MTYLAELEGQPVSFVFPVTLSRALRRDVLMRTGVEPTAAQIYVPGQFTDLSPDLRTRVVDTWDKINVHVDEEERYLPDGESYVHMNGARNDGYLWLHRDAHGRWVRYTPGSEGDAIDVDEVFFATPGRTIGALEHLRSTLDDNEMEALEAMLAGAPLVGDVGENNALMPDAVLGAYEGALELAQRLIDLVDGGTRDMSAAWLRGAFEIADEAIFLHPDPGQDPPNRPAAILKQTSRQAYDQARELLDQISSVPAATVREKIDRVCFHWWSLYADAPDERKVEALLKMAVTNMLNDVRLEQAKRQAAERYEHCRASWIAKHGSQRLKRAAARGYRHDGIYRDERLSVELPGFVGSLGRKPTIRELVNPSEQALDLEAQALARAEALGIPEEQVRLVFAQPGQASDWSDGEFVQIEGYLGRHAVWQSVSGERASDDIPF
ncbi:MAG: hypothetical protein JWO74_3133 [Solirubrobacterales bacterium]|nr:hypothetical protein [Solirubrobacterales bacterium]